MPVGVILCAECAKDIYRAFYPEEIKAEKAEAPESSEAETTEAPETEAPIEEAPHKVEITERKTAPRRKKAEGESAQ